MNCKICNNSNMKNCFQAGKSKPICENCFHNRTQFLVLYDTEELTLEQVDSVHKNMKNTMEFGDLTIDLKDIAFNDDSTCIFFCSIKNCADYETIRKQLPDAFIKNYDFLKDFVDFKIEEI